MFRNGIAIARRPLRQLTTHSKHEAPLLFVCTACQQQQQARAMASHAARPAKAARKPKVQQEDGMLDQIRRLEAHVRLMERSYVEQLRKRATEEEIPKGDVTEEDKDRAYAALMAPTESLFLPKPAEPVERLPAPIVKRLGEAELELVNSDVPEWKLVLTKLEETGGLEGMDAGAVNGMLACIELAQRVELSPRIFEMMKEANIEPDTFTYDLMMVAFAGMRLPAKVKHLFKQMKKKGLKPTVYSYGHLLKAYSQENDVAKAAKAFQEMQAAGIEPNLVVYTTLIQTCINRKDLDTAWQVFNLIKFKSTATAPDQSAYALMIHACALDGETEKALDLFADMTERRGIAPSAEVYHSVVHACAVRKDYFSEAWRYAVRMQREGMELNRRALNVLVQACGRTGELTRARLLVRHMMASGKEDFVPDRFTYQNLLRCYATCKVKRPRQQLLDRQVIDNDTAAFIQPGKELQPEKGGFIEKIPFLDKAVLETQRQVLDEAALIVNWLRETRPDMVDIQMMNSYMDVCVAQDSLMDLKWSYENDTKNPPNPFDRSNADAEENADGDETAGTATSASASADEVDATLLIDLPALNRNIHTFNTALQGALKFRNLPFARQVWGDRMVYSRTPLYLSLPKRLRDNLDFSAERHMINTLAATGLIGEALERIRILYEEGGIDWKWDDLKGVYTRAAEVEDVKTMRYIRFITGKDAAEYPPTLEWESGM